MKKIINVLVIFITIFALIASLAGILTSKGATKEIFISVYDNEVELYGTGIYQNDSIAIVAQGIAQDYVTIILGLPVLMIALYLYNKNNVRGKFLLSGMLGYFLYTYTTYTFLWTYNKLFLVYVALMSLSFFAFIILIQSIKINEIKLNFKEQLPNKFIGGFQIFIGIMVTLLWVGKIIPSLTMDEIPSGLDHYTTLVIQALDLGIIVPSAIMSGILLIKKNNYGYLLSSIIIIKATALFSSMSAMVFGQLLSGITISPIEIMIFISFNILSIFVVYVLLKNINMISSKKIK